MKRTTSNKSMILLCWLLVIGVFVTFLFIPVFTFTKTTSLGSIEEVVTIKFSIADLVREEPELKISSSLMEGEDVSEFLSYELKELIGEDAYFLSKRIVPVLIGFVALSWFVMFILYSLFFVKTNKTTDVFTFAYLWILVFICVLVRILPTTCVPDKITGESSWISYIVLLVISFAIMEIISRLTKGKKENNPTSQAEKTKSNGENKNIIIKDFGESKAKIIREIINVANLSIAVAPNIVKKQMIEDLPQEIAQELVERLTKLGASVEIM